MDNNTLAIVITIIAVGVAVGVGIIGVMITLIRQGGRHDADIAALRTESRADIAALRTELLTEIRAQREETRALGDRIGGVQQETREEMRALGDRIGGVQQETREEMRALGDRIENRINLDERVRAVEQRTPAAGD